MVEIRHRNILHYVRDIEQKLILLENKKKYTWLIDDVIKLFDSIVKGYPIGYILLHKNIVIDGFHRLQTIVKYLTQEYDLYYNLEEECFTNFYSGKHCVPISTLVNSRKLHKYEQFLSELYYDRAEKVGIIVCDFRISCAVSDSEIEAKEMKDRIN